MKDSEDADDVGDERLEITMMRKKLMILLIMTERKIAKKGRRKKILKPQQLS